MVGRFAGAEIGTGFTPRVEEDPSPVGPQDVSLDTVASIKRHFKTPAAARGSILNGLLSLAKASTAFRSGFASLSGCNG
jgi:hypothetical protein